jgi:pre-mRNA-processing factor 39
MQPWRADHAAWLQPNAAASPANLSTSDLGIAPRLQLTPGPLPPKLSQDDLTYVQAAYDAFLAEYPLCYGYWKKYADAYSRHTDYATATQARAAVGVATAFIFMVPQSNERNAARGLARDRPQTCRAVSLRALTARRSMLADPQVYERGVAATPYSCDLWAHYAAFKRSLPDASTEDVRG